MTRSQARPPAGAWPRPARGSRPGGRSRAPAAAGRARSPRRARRTPRARFSQGPWPRRRGLLSSHRGGSRRGRPMPPAARAGAVGQASACHRRSPRRAAADPTLDRLKPVLLFPHTARPRRATAAWPAARGRRTRRRVHGRGRPSPTSRRAGSTRRPRPRPPATGCLTPRPRSRPTSPRSATPSGETNRGRRVGFPSPRAAPKKGAGTSQSLRASPLFLRRGPSTPAAAATPRAT
jgi:hypothetical protein